MIDIEIVREPAPISEVVLRLSEEEAVAIAAALGVAPSGHPFQPLYSALRKAGLGYGHKRYDEFSRLSRS